MIVSHNTLTYLPPKDWWGWFLLPFTRCQCKDVTAQDFQVADIRLRFKKNQWWICHGKIRFCDLPHGLMLLQNKDIKDVRIIFETKDEDNINYGDFENYLFVNYPNMRFWTGRRKRDWKKLTTFPDLSDLYQYVGSMAGGILGNICPWLWWLLVGRKNKAKVQGERLETNISFDFL